MLFILRFFPLISNIINSFLFIWLYFNPKAVVFVAPVFLVITALANYSFLKTSYTLQLKTHKAKTFLLYLILPVLLEFYGFSFLLFIDQVYFYAAGAILLHFFLYIYEQDLFFYLYHPLKYAVLSLENISDYLSVLTTFLAAAGFFNFLVFLNISLWPLALIFFITILLLHKNIFFIHKISGEQIPKYFMFISSLILVELFLVLSYLPFSSYVNACILTLMFYFFLQINKAFFNKTLNKQLVKSNVIFSFLIMLAILATARWL